MPYVITEPCVSTKDRSCTEVCPVDCIQPVDGDETEHLFIDPEACIDCGACFTECPVNAIYMDTDVPAEWAHYVEINAAYFRRGESD